MTEAVVVVGGGVIGLSSAWRLAQGGASVTVVDAEEAAAASDVAAGMLAPVTEARLGEEPLLALYIWRGGPLAQQSEITGTVVQGRA